MAIGYLLAFLMGGTLGLIGGGGSILTVPILVYFLQIAPVEATAYSLLVVGTTALVGAWRYHLKNLIAYRVGITFALPSVLGVWIARAFLIPNLPEEVLTLGNTAVSKDQFVMLLFVTLMIMVAVFMLRKPHKSKIQKSPTKTLNYPLIGFEGFVVGLVTGIVGAGGGFLIVPALVFLAKIPMKQAVATSLAIIAVKSLIGFTGDLAVGFQPDLKLTLLFTGLTVVGMLSSVAVFHHFSETALKRAFGIVTLLLGITILIDQIRQII